MISVIVEVKKSLSSGIIVGPTGGLGRSTRGMLIKTSRLFSWIKSSLFWIDKVGNSEKGW